MTKTKISKAKALNITKVVVAIVLTLAVMFGVFVSGYYTNKAIEDKRLETYSMTATVTEVNPDTSDVYFETTSGHIFYIVTDEVFAVNETYTITFKTNGTATVEDDEIYLVTRDIAMY